jgi:hypothetical protein
MVIFLPVSCDGVTGNPGKDEGNLLIRFPGAEAGDDSAVRAAVPGAGTLAQLEYRITLTNGSQSESAVVAPGRGSAVLRVAPGVWDI